jgi:hypothetical protein
VAKLADAPDLGLRNHRFQNIAFRFKGNGFYQGKITIFLEKEQRAEWLAERRSF